jgi:hypothetical protein
LFRDTDPVFCFQQKAPALSGAFLFDDDAEVARAKAHVAKPPMDKPTRKIKNGIRD